MLIASTIKVLLKQPELIFKSTITKYEFKKMILINTPILKIATHSIDDFSDEII